MSLAWPAWRAVACNWDILSTGADTGPGATPAAADADDLVLRTGRLAYARPDWTPACTATSPARAPAELAATLDAMTSVIAAVRHGADAIHRIAADQQAVQSAVATGQVYVPTRLLPERYDIPHRYIRAPARIPQALLAAYNSVTSTSARVTVILDDLAAAIGAPSKMLTG